MAERPPPRPVYSSDRGRLCPGCGWPVDSCACASSSRERGDEPLPDRITAKIRIEKQGRAGKTVTVVDGLPNNARFLEGLARELKRACGTGGTVRDGLIELQGDVRGPLRELLAREKMLVKG